MPTLKEIKDQYAQERGFISWNSFDCDIVDRDSNLMNADVADEIAIRYAKAKLEEAAERATASHNLELCSGSIGVWVDKDSITNTPLD